MVYLFFLIRFKTFLFSWLENNIFETEIKKIVLNVYQTIAEIYKNH